VKRKPAILKAIQKLSVSLSRSNGWWLTLLLLLVVLVPSACLLWFMNQAVQNERLAVRQKLVDAYRGHLSLASERLENFWRQTAGELDARAEKTSAPALFAEEVRAGRADSVINFYTQLRREDLPGTAPRPRETVPPGWQEAQRLEATDPTAAADAYARIAAQVTNVNHAALALQSQARCLVRSGKKAEAISVLTGPLAEDRYRNTTDAEGRLIAPNAGLMAIELVKDSAPEKAAVLYNRLKEQVLNYDSAMSSSQRRFLMRELQRSFPDQKEFPMLASEDLAARYAEAGAGDAMRPGLHPSPLPGIWQFSSSRGLVVTLHKTENLLARMRAAAATPDLPADVRVDFVAPGQDAEGSLLSLPAGSTFQGWRLALSLRDQRLFDTATSERARSYVWIGALVVATVIVLAVLALGLVRRQAALTQLRNDLVANVTHELKTPLSSMRLLVETLLNSPRLDEKIAREYLDLIAKENVRLSRLIDNFLTFSRIERNKYTFDFKEVSASTIAEEAVAAVRERFNTSGCHFDVQVGADMPRVVADADAMVTALVNLLDNAYKYSGEPKEITLATAAQNGSVFFTVKDNGIGLSPRETKRIFRRFYQVNQSSSPATGGCGIGLSIVQFVVTAHHGTVRVESELNRGSTFILTLPASGSNNQPEKKI
jgi:signal transduction histidine kinase